MRPNGRTSGRPCPRTTCWARPNATRSTSTRRRGTPITASSCASASPVTGIDRTAHEVALADGSRIGYARLLLATGSSPRRLRVPGADADGVLYLRRVGDSDQIKATFQAASRIAVIGAGWIGLECAAAARAAGVAVTLLETAELPLLRVLGPEAARVFAGLHPEHRGGL